MLDERQLLDIKDLFVYIRAFASPNSNDELQACIAKIAEKRMLINHLSSGFQRDIFVYCLNNLEHLIATQQYEYVDDFSDAVHNLSDIFMYDYRTLSQFWKLYIKPLRKKHGEQLFAQFEEIFDKNTTVPVLLSLFLEKGRYFTMENKRTTRGAIVK